MVSPIAVEVCDSIMLTVKFLGQSIDYASPALSIRSGFGAHKRDTYVRTVFPEPARSVVSEDS